MSKKLCPKVVVVEDDTELRSSLIFQLEMEGLRTKAFDSGKAFWRRGNARTKVAL